MSTGKTVNLLDLCVVLPDAQRDEGLCTLDLVVGVHNFLKVPYFERRWIVQEILLSRKAQIFWGPHTLPWADLSICLQKILPSGDTDLFESGAFAFKDTSWDIFQSGGSNILPLMLKYQHMQCEDPRDRIAALKGLWQGHAACMETFTVDYAKSVAANYFNFVQLLSQTSECGRLLVCAAFTKSFALHHGEQLEHVALPSWVPDWRYISLQTGPSICQVTFPLSLNKQKGSLATRGWIVDKVVRVEKAMAGEVRFWKIECVTASFDKSLNCGGVVKSEIVQPGDKICVFSKAQIRRAAQFVIRPLSTHGNEYHLIGVCEWSHEAKEKFSDDAEWDLPSGPSDIILV